MNSNKILIDTNLLIYHTDTSSTHSENIESFFRKNTSNIVLSSQVINEYLRATTHKVFQQPLTIDEAITNILLYTNSFGSPITPNSATHRMFINLLKKYKTSSNKIFDLYLVSTALSNNINTIATFNIKDFRKFKEISTTEIL